MDLNTWLTPAAILVAITLGTILFKFASWHGRVNSDRHTFKEFMKEVKKDLEEIKVNISELSGKVSELSGKVSVLVSQDTIDTSDSPTRLNKKGKSISEEIQGKQWAKVVAKQYVDAQREKQPYDIQKFAFDQAYKFEFSKDMVEKMKQSAWENGVPIEIIIRVLAYELRDELLTLLGMDPPKEHPDQ